MVFLDRPAEDPSELFDRTTELDRLRKAVLTRAITLVLGLRRTGKTSLVKAGTKGLDRIYIDARRFEVRRYITYDDFINEFIRSINEFIPLRQKVLDFLGRVRGISVAGVRIELSGRGNRTLFPSILDSLNEWATSSNTHLVIVIDEVQELSRMRGASLLPIFAYAYDNLRSISFVFTGSKVGLLYNYLRLNDPASPLYGRYLETIELGPLGMDEAREYLVRGFRDAGVDPPMDLINKAVDRLDGIIGWLSLFGLTWLRTRSEDALDETIKVASGIVTNEFCNFVNSMGSPRYVLVIKALKFGATWSEVKRYLELKESRSLSDSEVTKLLVNLVNNGFVIKRGGEYVIADPVLREVADSINCR